MLNQSTAAAILKNQAAKSSLYSFRSSAFLFIAALGLFCLLILPLAILFKGAFLNSDGQYIGLANFIEYFSNPSLFSSIFNSIWIASVATAITVLMASIYAYALTVVDIKGKGILKAIAFLPILAPSILPSLALVYLFGQQGVLKSLLGNTEIYGPLGILISYCFWLFPAIFILMLSAFRNIDQSLIEASRSLGKGLWATHRAVTLPAIRYGLVSAALVAFTYVLTDFGIPKVIGGSFNMMALDVYKQIIGQQNMQMGAVISILLLCPALLAFVFDRYQSKRQARYQNFQVKPYVMKASTQSRWLFSGFCYLIAGFILLLIITAIVASFIRYWPYDLSMTLDHYRFEYVQGGGWDAYFNSLKLAGFTTLVGSVVIFMVALCAERFKVHPLLKNLVQMLTLLPLAIPGLVLGIAYILFFNDMQNPLHILYGTMSLLVISTIIHYYTVPHLTLSSTIKQIPVQLEAAAQSLGSSRWKTFYKVYLPLSLPALCDISVYLFVNAMTTVSAAIFLYSPDTNLAAVSILNMDDAGDTASAVAMSVLILLTSAIVKLIHGLLTRGILKKTQAWREASY